jgi:hypothetical protein
VIGEDGKYLPHEKALKELGKMSLNQLGQLGNDFIKAAEEAASGGPKASKESTEPTSQD